MIQAVLVKMYRKKLSFLVLLTFFSLFCTAKAQLMIGNTGGFNIPTAEMNPAGTFRGGLNYLDRGMMTSELKTNDHRWMFDYYTFNYYVNFTFFDWLEATFRETLLESPHKDHYCYCQQDRSVSVKVRVLKESEYLPAIAIGTNDPWADTGHHIYASAWLVMTKHLDIPLTKGSWTANLGYSKAFDNSVMYDGILCGISYRPYLLPFAQIMTEYDTKGWNLGVEANLWNHLGIYCFTREFSAFNAGINYHTTIKYKKR